jgi:SsrA-binding protein
MAKQKATTTKRISNRRARHDYQLEDSLVAGIQLSGAETKALRHGHGQLRGAFVTLKDNELWLINATISPMSGIPISEADQTRSRKLLVKRSELKRLVSAKEQGRAIVPLELLTAGRYIKLRLALGQGKKRYDKRETIKKRTTKIDMARELRNRN